MERIFPTAGQVTKRVNAAITASDTNVATIAEATDTDADDLQRALIGARPLNVVDLFRVGGFLHMSAPDFLRGGHA